MREDKEKYIRHVQSGKHLMPDERAAKEKILEHNLISQSGVCPRCEKIAFMDKGKYSCPNCGWRGETITVEEYTNKKMYK